MPADPTNPTKVRNSLDNPPSERLTGKTRSCSRYSPTSLSVIGAVGDTVSSTRSSFWFSLVEPSSGRPAATGSGALISEFVSKPRNRGSLRAHLASTRPFPFPWSSPRPEPAPAWTPSEPASLPSSMSPHRARSERAPALLRPHRLSRSRRNALRQCLAADPLPLGNEVHPQAPRPPQRPRQRLPNEEENSLQTTRIQRTPPCLLISARSSTA